MIKLTLERMKFDLVKSVSYKITEISFNFLFEQCKESMKIEEYENVRLDFISNEVEVIRLVKPGGNFEIEAITGKNNVLSFLKFDEDETSISDYNILLKERCFLAKISKDIEYLYDIIEPKLAVIEGSFLLNNKNIIHDIINS